MLAYDFREWEPPCVAPVRKIVGSGTWGASHHRLTAVAYNAIASGRTASWRQWAGTCPPDASRCEECTEEHDRCSAREVHLAAQAATTPCTYDAEALLLLCWNNSDPLATEDVLQMVQWGAHSLYFGSRCWSRVVVRNHDSFEERLEEVGASLLREANLGWYYFSENLGPQPTDNYVAPPKAAVEKKPKNGKKRPPRIIVNASALTRGSDGRSQKVNDKMFKLHTPLDSTPDLVARMVAEIELVKCGKKRATGWSACQGDFDDGFSSLAVHPLDYHLSGSIIPWEVYQEVKSGLDSPARARWKKADTMLGDRRMCKGGDNPSHVCGYITRLNNGRDKNPHIFGKLGRVVKEGASRFAGARSLGSMLDLQWLALYVDDYNYFGPDVTFEVRADRIQLFFVLAAIGVSKEEWGKLFALIGYLWDLRQMQQGKVRIGVSGEKRQKAADTLHQLMVSVAGVSARDVSKGVGRARHCFTVTPVAYALLKPLYMVLKSKLACVHNLRERLSAKHDAVLPWPVKRKGRPLHLHVGLFVSWYMLDGAEDEMVDLYSAYGQPCRHIWLWADTSRGNSKESDYGLPHTGYTYGCSDGDIQPPEFADQEHRATMLRRGLVVHSARVAALAVRGKSISTSYVEGAGIASAIDALPEVITQGAHLHVKNDSKVFLEGAEAGGMRLCPETHAVHVCALAAAARKGIVKINFGHVMRDEVDLEDSTSKKEVECGPGAKVSTSYGLEMFLCGLWNVAVATPRLEKILRAHHEHLSRALDAQLAGATSTDAVVECVLNPEQCAGGGREAAAVDLGLRSWLK